MLAHSCLSLGRGASTPTTRCVRRRVATAVGRRELVGGGATAIAIAPWGSALALTLDSRGYEVCGDAAAVARAAKDAAAGRAIYSQPARDNANRRFLKWLCGELDTALSAGKVPVKDAVRLALMDVASGAADGSVVSETDASAPHTVGLKPTVAVYKAAKKAIDAKLLDGFEVGYGDLIALGGKVSMNRAFRSDFSGKTDRFSPKVCYKRGEEAATLDIDTDADFLKTFYARYSPVDLGTGGTPVLLGRADCKGDACVSTLSIPVGNASATAADYKAWWVDGLGAKVLDLAHLADYYDSTGAASAALRQDDQLRGFIEKNESTQDVPGIVERRVVYAYSDAMQIGSGLLGQGDSMGKFDQNKYVIALYAGEWTAAGAMGDVDGAYEGGCQRVV